MTPQWSVPSFISQWYYIEANATGELDVHIGFDNLPAKVDVQIKIVKNGVDYIFTGTGTAQRENNLPPEFGGIVYIYSSTNVKIYIPNSSLNGTSYGGVAYTGTCLKT